MTISPRIIASLVRLSDPITAERIVDRMLFDVRPLEGDTIATQLWGHPGPGIILDEAWLASASDETLDQIIAHEITHTAYGPGGEDVKNILGNFTHMKAKFVPAEARDDYNRAMDAMIEATIGTKAIAQ